MYQVITEEKYDEFGISDRYQAMYFTVDDKLVSVGVLENMRQELLDYVREHADDWSEDECYYILDMNRFKAIMITKITAPFFDFMATMTPDNPRV